MQGSGSMQLSDLQLLFPPCSILHHVAPPLLRQARMAPRGHSMAGGRRK